MKHFVAFLSLMMAWGIAQARAPQTVVSHGDRVMTVTRNPEILHAEYYDDAAANTRISRVDGTDAVKLRCNFVWDPALFVPDEGIILNGSGTYEFRYDWENPYADVEIAPGTYDIVFNFDYYQDEMGPKTSPAYIFMEDVVVDKDMEITFDSSAATHRVKFRNRLADGREAVLPVLKINDTEPYLEWDASNATVDDVTYKWEIHNRKYDQPVFAGFGNAGYINYYTGFDTQDMYDYLVNDISDRWKFVHQNLFYGIIENFDMFFSYSECDGIPEGTVYNRADDFMPPWSPQVLNSPLADKNENFGLYSEAEILYSKGGQMRTSTRLRSGSSGKYKFYFSRGFDTGHHPLMHDILVSAQVVDRAEEINDGWTDIVISSGVRTPYARLDDDRIEYCNMGIGLIFGRYEIQNDDDGNMVMTPHGRFSFMEEGRYVFGATAPVLVLVNAPWTMDGSKVPALRYVSLGRHGEGRNSDTHCATVKLEADGAVVDGVTDMETLETGLRTRAMDGVSPGFLEMTIDNRNVRVGGTDGYSIAEIGMYEEGEDVCPPTVTFLQTRNGRGEITDRFGNLNDGVIEFTGGDFNYNDEIGNFSCVPPHELKVEYAPMGDEEFSEFMVEELPEMFVMPAFRCFWRGDVSQITRESANGWYSLRVTMRDDAGNYQVQTVAPAFHIAKMSGMDTVAVGDEAVVCRGRDIVAPDDAVVYNTRGQRVGLTGLEPGIYLVATGGYVVKVAVR